MPGPVTLILAALFDGQTRGDYRPFIAVFLFGMVVAIAGHLSASRDLILAGIVIAGVAAMLPWAVWG